MLLSSPIIILNCNPSESVFLKIILPAMFQGGTERVVKVSVTSESLYDVNDDQDP